MLKVAVRMPPATGDAGEFLADVRALEAAGADMLMLDTGDDQQLILLGAIAALTGRIRLHVADPRAHAVVQRVSFGRALPGLPEEERWTEVAMPPDRTSWAAALREHEAAGATGVVVPWDPRLIDLLRNSEPEDRSDLLMSTG